VAKKSPLHFDGKSSLSVSYGRKVEKGANFVNRNLRRVKELTRREPLI